jgi:hypothetical protein
MHFLLVRWWCWILSYDACELCGFLWIWKLDLISVNLIISWLVPAVGPEPERGFLPLKSKCDSTITSYSVKNIVWRRRPQLAKSMKVTLTTLTVCSVSWWQLVDTDLLWEKNILYIMRTCRWCWFWFFKKISLEQTPTVSQTNLGKIKAWQNSHPRTHIETIYARADRGCHRRFPVGGRAKKK